MFSPLFVEACCPLFNRNKSSLPICIPVLKAGFFHDVNETTLYTVVFFVVPLVRPLLKRRFLHEDILWCSKGIDGGT
jgi:hypothetical protein